MAWPWAVCFSFCTQHVVERTWMCKHKFLINGKGNGCRDWVWKYLILSEMNVNGDKWDGLDPQ